MESPNWHELQYLPSLTVAGAGDVIPGWERRSAKTRVSFPFQADVSYGGHARETIDFFSVENATSTLVYIHGGYWRMLSKVETSFVAEEFLRKGHSVALVNYPLCPEVSISQIRTSIQNAFAYLYKNMLTVCERENIVVAGHSAGGHLAALHLATDWTAYGLPANPVNGVLSLSGVFDVESLIHTSLNDTLSITQKSAADINLNTAPLKSKAYLVLAVGGDEPSEFHRQSLGLAKAWAGLKPQIKNLAGFNHYTIVDSLADRTGDLHQMACDLLSKTGKTSVAGCVQQR